jgi:hypothetical protein
VTITIKWIDDSKRVISYRIQSPWTWEEADQVKDQLNQMIESVDHPVDCIFDVSAVGALPRNTLQVAFERYNFIPKNVGVYVMVGAPSSIRAVMDVLRIMRPSVFSRYHLVKTLEDAYRFITSRQTFVY